MLFRHAVSPLMGDPLWRAMNSATIICFLRASVSRKENAGVSLLINGSSRRTILSSVTSKLFIMIMDRKLRGTVQAKAVEQ